MRGGLYSLSVPASKKKGAKYFNDETLLGLMNGQFSGKSKMRAEFEQENLDAVLKRLDEMGVTVNEETRLRVSEGGVQERKISKNEVKHTLDIPEDIDKDVSLQTRNLKTQYYDNGKQREGLLAIRDRLRKERDELEKQIASQDTSKDSEAIRSERQLRLEQVNRELNEVDGAINKRIKQRIALKRKYNVDAVSGKATGVVTRFKKVLEDLGIVERLYKNLGHPLFNEVVSAEDRALINQVYAKRLAEVAVYRREIEIRHQRASKLLDKYGITFATKEVSIDTLERIFNDLNKDEEVGKIFNDVISSLRALGTKAVSHSIEKSNHSLGFYSHGLNLIAIDFGKHIRSGATGQELASSILHEMLHPISSSNNYNSSLPMSAIETAIGQFMEE